jgi:N4-gp56 family major capsid protein
VQYANGKASQSAVISGDFMTLLEIRKAVKTLKRANAKPVPAAGNRFPLLVHTDTTFDLQSDTNITNIWQYGGAGSRQADIFDATFQDLPFGVRVYESTLCPLKAASGYTDYYTSFLLGKDAYGTLKLDALPAKIIVHEPGSSGVSDPLDQVGTVGWKANWAAVILNQNNLVRIVHQTSSFVGTRSAAL